MLLGKAIRLNRLFSHPSGRYLAVAIDHGISYNDYEIPKGIDRIDRTIKQIVAGRPNSITLQKGIANSCFMEYAGQVPLIMQTVAYTPPAPWKDYQIAFIEEAIALGADAVAMAIGVIGDYQGEEVAMLSRLIRDALPYGIPVIGHIYPKGNTAKPEDFYALKYVKYAAHIGAEIGLDIVKVPYTGTSESFADVVASCPVKVVAAGGSKTSSITEVLEMAHSIIEAGAVGITFGRNVWQHDNIVAVLAALKAIVYENKSVEESFNLYKELSGKEK